MSDFIIENGILIKYEGTESDLFVPDGITGIGDKAFWRCASLQSVALPDSVTSIGMGAFCWCASLRSITIPSGVTDIGESAFEHCRSLENITLPDGVTSIGECAFENCRGLQSIHIPDSVIYIGWSAFEACRRLERVRIPNGVTSICPRTFDACSSLQSVTIPDSVTVIGSNAFNGCISLQNVTLPDGVTSIGKAAFGYCPKLQSIHLPNSVTEIDEYAFYLCEGLQSVTVSNASATIAKDAFAFCKNLTEFSYGGSVSMIFGEKLPSALSHKIGDWYSDMTDGAIKNYVLPKEIWSSLAPELQADIFVKKQSKPLLGLFAVHMTADLAERIAARYQRDMQSALSSNDCKRIVSFMTEFHAKLSRESLRSLHTALQAQKKVGKALDGLSKDTLLMQKLTDAPQENLSDFEKRILDLIEKHKISEKETAQLLKMYYGLTPKDIPEIVGTDGKPMRPAIIYHLLTAHESVNADRETVAAYQTPGPSPEAAELLALLDPQSFETFLRALADTYLGAKTRTKKLYLAFPICRYANEALMEYLTKKAPSWRSAASGNASPPLYTFRRANLYSETRAALMFAEKMKDLDAFASVRGTTADALRDRVLSDIGLSADGRKSYDLGNQEVSVVLQRDLSFLVLLANGKTAKSIPKKGADPIAYATANADFTSMKKNAKAIVKNRKNVLFEQFLNAKSCSADDWKAAYIENPLLRAVASLLVWRQNSSTFLLTDNGTITSDGNSYEIGNAEIMLAHPMEMNAEDLSAWQKYFVANNIKQPFEQIWEPVVDQNTVTKDRYKGCMIPYYRFTGKQKHGIFVEDFDFHNEIKIRCKNCTTVVERIDFGYHEINPEDRFEITEFSFGKYTRMTNHIAAYLDRITVYGRIAKDDVSVARLLPGFTLAQITEFIRIATENNAVNVTALLLNYKNEVFPDFDPMDEFSLDFDD